MIPVRDGTRLFTSVYTPADTTRTYPLLVNRTPYGVGPYGEGSYPAMLGPSPAFLHGGFIFVYQDVRGTHMSEGTFVNMTPQKRVKRTRGAVDESSDAYDSIDWLVRNIPHNNGRCGLWGVSYPGFYAAAGMIDAHPSVKAVSPQAPIVDWFAGDDFHHNGAFFLQDAFDFFSGFGKPRPSRPHSRPTGLHTGRTTRTNSSLISARSAALTRGFSAAPSRSGKISWRTGRTTGSGVKGTFSRMFVRSVPR